MVEIALAIAVVGIGVTGVMSLFPIGFNALRDAMAESYSADTVEEFMGYVSMAVKNDWANYISTADNAGKFKSYSLASGLYDADTNHETQAWVEAYPNGGIYTTSLGDDIFGIWQKTGSYTDFQAHVKIWKGPITKLNIAGRTIDFSDPDMSALRYELGTTIYAEISWPLVKPYSKREKRVYYKELFKPQ